jgi:hypothetical protein
MIKMNLQETIDWIKSNPKVINVKIQEDHFNYVFLFITYEIDSNIAGEESICLIVKNRDVLKQDKNNPETERVYFKNNIPFYLKEQESFTSELNNFIQNMKNDDTSKIEAIKLTNIDEKNSFAEAIIFPFDNVLQKVSEQKIIIYRKDNKLTYKNVGS